VQIPSFPTDSLYKFMATSGIAIVLICQGLLLFADYQMRLADAKREAAFKIAEKRLARIEHEQRLTHKSVNEPLPKTFRSNTEKQMAISKIEEDQKSLREERNRVDAMWVDLIVAERQFNESMVLWKMVQGQKMVWSIAAAWGIVQTLFGFALWYFLIQRFQDQLLRSEVTKSGARYKVRRGCNFS
jgi:C4-dicarboxylate-specific signal transduction histidine kinase